MRIASEAEIQSAVASARKTCPELPDGLTPQFVAARMTIDEVKAQLFEEMTTVAVAASVLAFAPRRRTPPTGGEAA